MHKIDTDKFQARCSSLEKIMGKIGLSDKQEKKRSELQKRFNGEGRALTANQTDELAILNNKKLSPKLPEGCITYLKEWYAEQKYGEREDIQTKYTRKGNLCEDEAILVIEDMFGEFGERMEKNDKRYTNGWINGEPDVVGTGVIYDAKCPWDGKTFLDAVTSPHNTLYIWQMRGYLFLTKSSIAKVCYCLLDTPADANYGEEVIFSDIPIEDRFYSFAVLRDLTIEKEIVDRVKLCREWLKEYDVRVLKALNND